jgi:hypothetical protein
MMLGVSGRSPGDRGGSPLASSRQTGTTCCGGEKLVIAESPLFFGNLEAVDSANRPDFLVDNLAIQKLKQLRQKKVVANFTAN